jgi:hypothetical protein
LLISSVGVHFAARQQVEGPPLQRRLPHLAARHHGH